MLSDLRLVPCDAEVASLAVGFGARYGLRAADAVDLASAVHVGAEVFHTNNTKGYLRDRITEIEVCHPAQL